MGHTLNEAYPESAFDERQQLHCLGRDMACNVHALVAGKINPRNLKLTFVASIAAIAHSDRPRLSRHAGTGIRRQSLEYRRAESGLSVVRDS